MPPRMYWKIQKKHAKKKNRDGFLPSPIRRNGLRIIYSYIYKLCLGNSSATLFKHMVLANKCLNVATASDLSNTPVSGPPIVRQSPLDVYAREQNHRFQEGRSVSLDWIPIGSLEWYLVNLLSYLLNPFCVDLIKCSHKERRQFSLLWKGYKGLN